MLTAGGAQLEAQGEQGARFTVKGVTIRLDTRPSTVTIVGTSRTTPSVAEVVTRMLRTEDPDFGLVPDSGGQAPIDFGHGHVAMPGWYEDPFHPSSHRWWDGRRWTAESRRQAGS